MRFDGFFYFEGIRFEGAFIIGNPGQNGGFEKCLHIFRNGSSLDSYDYFGDNKFEVVEHIKQNNNIQLKVPTIIPFKLMLEDPGIRSKYEYINFYLN